MNFLLQLQFDLTSDVHSQLPNSLLRSRTLQNFPPQISRGEHNWKKRLKLARIADPVGDSNTLLGTPKPRSGMKPDSTVAKITRPFSECGKKFWSWKALFGHMRCHPERQWRGINPPPNFHRPDLVKGPTQSRLLPQLTNEDHDVGRSPHALCCWQMGLMPPICQGCGLTRVHPIPASPLVKCWEVSMWRQPAWILLSSQFECSSCKRVFGSHQALGGHRACHKNAKGCFGIARGDGAEGDGNYNDANEGVGDGGEAEEIGREAGREMVIEEMGHKCSICLRVLSTGQAFLGHKRCHLEKGHEQGCAWDLNLPASIENEGSTSDVVLDLRLGI